MLNPAPYTLNPARCTLEQKELDYLGGAVDEPKRPFAAIVGGTP